MITQAVNVINLSVNTVAGKHLGRVVGVEVEPSGRQIKYYQVSSALPLVKLWGEKLLISPAQVVSISIKEMTVADSFSQDLAKASNQANLVPEPTV
ncbi:MAG: hypothetical protein UV57_C0058G0002 [Parcubacteria group bacterium GW2011_GWD2_43_10]|uniref:PRC-barrel domain-containing protein n=2 Tax=Candidatus Vebleniibacteriota TaxID=1817921 RepID=A0A1G2Q647_9BACT|nr:MAG: hypothetical protein UV57_C0058G0002 [Parcubacteria group bacterium GW2011_GWD2_43_10]KKS92957.1 MAG: hypothetical protein UV69_C0017G0001 [Parcubacteria group bacterium GW2011_GWE2_43_12]OHA55391.1 MAG: hypothetical protein A2226_03205 [Candidatus Veblenbacteria bacterium RIFOXYA2_FULL_43_9]OHA57323.1 MAG: hypothetical protein A2441_00710 [Candidatus Veblenbacteria bacterium RIFOXYC2_FULL_42_11]HBZ36567.1 hypothetical protein [Candidatus Veblenbacteria bacterium]